MKHSNFKFGFIKVSFLAQVSHLVNSKLDQTLTDKVYLGTLGSSNKQGVEYFIKIAFYCICKLLHNQSLLLLYNCIGSSEIES